jgi:hypothetical protein
MWSGGHMSSDYLAWLDSQGYLKPCPKCGHKDALRHILRDGGTHYANIVCDHCDELFVQFGRKPDSLKPTRKAEHKRLAEKFIKDTGVNYCQICFRTQQDLPKGETLEAHHVLEYSGGGDADMSNIWLLCSKHHALVHHERTYIGHYLERIIDMEGAA